MRHILLIYQNTEAWNGLSQEDKEALAGYCIRDIASLERSEEIAARWPDAQHWGMEIPALMHGGGEEG
jgi:hypothetical protein